MQFILGLAFLGIGSSMALTIPPSVPDLATRSASGFICWIPPFCGSFPSPDEQDLYMLESCTRELKDAVISINDKNPGAVVAGGMPAACMSLLSTVAKQAEHNGFPPFEIDDQTLRWTGLTVEQHDYLLANLERAKNNGSLKDIQMV